MSACSNGLSQPREAEKEAAEGSDPEEDVTVLRARIAHLERELSNRDEFLSIAAHELRNPMHALLLQVSAAVSAARQQGMAAGGGAGAGGSGGYAALLRRLERVQQIVDRYVKRASLLLDVARINATRQQLHTENLDFAEVVRDVVDSYTAEAEFHRCTLLTRAPERLPGRWDRLAVEQIVSNLVSNAVKFGAGSPVCVELCLIKDGCWVQFQVADRGIGIAPEDQGRIFGRFEQLPVHGLRGVGAGLGLWLVRELVDVHGGSVSVMSAPGNGATFTVKLPITAGAQGEMGDGG